jgi:hypothetical protein
MNRIIWLFFLLLAALGGAALGWYYTTHSTSAAQGVLDPATDLAGYVSLRKRILYVQPGQQQTVLDHLGAQSLGDGRYRATIDPLFEQQLSVRFKIVATEHPHLFMWLDENPLEDAADAVADVITGAVVDAVKNALGRTEQEPVSGANVVLIDGVRGVAVWKNARCGTPEPAQVIDCQGPIPADGAELAGLYWRSTHYSRAKCVKGDDICTDIRQAGGFIELAIDQQCNIVRDIKPIDTNLYCRVRRQ